MILDLTNTFFKQDPFEVYQVYNISKEEWENIWYKCKFLEYKPWELSEYITDILHKKITEKQLSRMLMRYEVYILTQPLIKRNEQTIHISYYPKNVLSFIKDYYHEKLNEQTSERRINENVLRNDRKIFAKQEDEPQITFY